MADYDSVHVSHLVSLLAVLENCPDVESTTKNRNHPYIRACESLSVDVLITDVGKVHFGNVNALIECGYRVTPGEMDGFGWLTGIIHTTKGRIVFG